MLTRLKYTACIVVSLMACYGATKLKLQSPIVERQVIQQEAILRPVPLPQFALLDKNIDDREKFWNRVGE